jgi:hypothetical protein
MGREKENWWKKNQALIFCALSAHLPQPEAQEFSALKDL